MSGYQIFRRWCALVVLAAALPPFAFLLSMMLAPGSTIPSDWAVLITWWSIAGCMVGIVGSIWLASARNSKLWLLLLIPSLADGFFAFASAMAIGMARMH